MKNFKAIILTIASLLTLASCFLDRPKGFYIDNPTQKTIQVVIDDTIKYEVKPKEYKFALALPKGDHTVQTDGGTKKSFTIRSDYNQYNYLLNATGATYIEVTEYYSIDKPDELMDRIHDSMARSITVDNSIYYGIFRIKDAVFIENSWEHSVVGKFPETIEIHPETKSRGSSKLFRLDDFKKEYKDYKITEEEMKEIEKMKANQQLLKY